MHYIKIIKNSDIDNNQTNVIYKHYYKDHINYLNTNPINPINSIIDNNSNKIKMICLFDIYSDYLPYSICYMSINENNKSINKLPPSLKMLNISNGKQIQLDKIYNLPLLIQYMYINHKLFITYKYILATYLKLTDIIIDGIIIPPIKLDDKKCPLIKYNLHLYTPTNNIFSKCVYLSLQN